MLAGDMRKLALVVQRYGPKVTGGAEYHSRWVVDQLRDHFDITVFTTTADDYVTWEEAFPAGRDEIDGIPVMRYPILEQRDTEHFEDYSEWIFHERHRPQDEERWLRMQGPYCPDLIAALEEQQYDFDMFLFFTYLYYPTAVGLPLLADRSVLLPTAHDELAIRLEMYKKVFAAPLGFILNTHEERRFLENMFAIQDRPQVVAGVGIEWPDPPPPIEPVLEKYGLKQPFAITSGRISVGKGHDVILKSLKNIYAEMDLVLFGKTEVELPDDPRVHFLGFVSEEEKWALTRAAAFSIQPSRYESLSLTLLESWAMGVPTLVNRGCAVLMDHVNTCHGGLSFSNEQDFPTAFTRLASNAEYRRTLGERGRTYVTENYQIDMVRRKYIDLLNQMIAERIERAAR